MSTLSRKILKSSLQLFTGQGIGFVCAIISGYFYALFLGPAVYGIWQTARVFLNYGTFTSLGIPFIMRRDFIILRAEGKHAEAEKMAHVAISYNFIVNPLIGLIFILIAVVSKSELAFRASLVLVGIMYVTEIFSGIGTILHRGINDYKTVGIARIIYGLGTVVLIPIVYFHGYYALLIGYLGVSIIQSSYYFLRRPISYKWAWDFPLLRKMVFAAFPLFLVTIISTVFTSIDRLLIAGLLDFANVGLYSLSSFIAQPITLLLSSFSIVIFTQVTERYGKSKEPHVIEKQVYIPQKFFSYVLPPVIGMGVVMLPVLTSVFLPKYQAGITAAQINIFALLFLKLAAFSSGGLFILDKLKYTAISFFIAGCVKTTGGYFALKAGYGIESVAVFTLLAYFIYNAMMLYHINRSLGRDIRTFLSRLRESLLCPVAILAICIIYIAYGDVFYHHIGINNPWVQMAAGLFMIAAISTRFLYRAYASFKRAMKTS